MHNVVISFGNYPTILQRTNQPGPYTSEELGLMWLKHVGSFSAPGMLSKYRLVLLLPRDILIPDTYNPELDKWGEKKRFDENNSVQHWPLGPNMVFQQVLWLYHYKKIEGPFLWCEPDCVPTKPTWLDDLFAEYERERKPFMGAFVEALTLDGVRTPKHMSGIAIYPDKPYLLAPLLMEARVVPWDCYAANQVITQCHFTNLIQHDRGVETPRANPETVLYHPDKVGALIKKLSDHEFIDRQQVSESIFGKPLVEVLAVPEIPPIDTMLDQVLLACRNDKDVQRKVAYFMLENGIVTHGFSVQYLKRKKKEAAHAEQPAA